MSQIVELDPVSLDDLGADEVGELARSSIYTWEFRNRTENPPDFSLEVDAHTGRAVSSPANGGDSAPHDD